MRGYFLLVQSFWQTGHSGSRWRMTEVAYALGLHVLASSRTSSAKATTSHALLYASGARAHLTAPVEVHFARAQRENGAAEKLLVDWAHELEPGVLVRLRATCDVGDLCGHF